MAEKRGRFLFNPSFNAFIKRLTTKAPKRAIKKISSLAFERLMTSWPNGQGFDEKGNKTSWSRSPDSTRANDIMIDTGHLKSSVIIKLIDDVIKDVPLIYDLSVTTSPPELVTQRALDHYNRGKPESLNQSYQLDSSCKSIIVWNVFSRVAYDYHYKNNFLPEIISRLNTILYDNNFGYDDYLLNRKQFAIRSGAATLAKPSLAFHKRFGMNYKIDLLFTNAEFEDIIVIEDTPRYNNCIGCDAPC